MEYAWLVVSVFGFFITWWILGKTEFFGHEPWDEFFDYCMKGSLRFIISVACGALWPAAIVVSLVIGAAWFAYNKRELDAGRGTEINWLSDKYQWKKSNDA